MSPGGVEGGGVVADASTGSLGFSKAACQRFIEEDAIY